MTVTLSGLQRRGQATIRRSTYAGGVATEVRARMARLDVTQSQLAEALAMSPFAVSRRLRGEVPFDVAELAASAELLGCKVLDLLPPDGHGDPVLEVRRRNKECAIRDSNPEPADSKPHHVAGRRALIAVPDAA